MKNGLVLRGKFVSDLEKNTLINEKLKNSIKVLYYQYLFTPTLYNFEFKEEKVRIKSFKKL